MDDVNFLLPPTVHLGYLPDSTIISYIKRARTQLRFVGPGMSQSVAENLVLAWERLGRDAVQVVLEADSDLCRLGYCDSGALQLIQATAIKLGAVVFRLAGLRLCVLQIDGERIIFPPTPRLVDVASESSSEILLSPNVEAPLNEQILSSEVGRLAIMTDNAVNAVCEDLSSCPPQEFDLARQVRVFSTRFQFVEFSLQNAALTRKRAKVPSDLLGLAPNADSATQDLLRASFQLISKGDKVSGDSLMEHRTRIESNYTVSFGDYGRIIRQDNREAFEEEITQLKDEILQFQKDSEKNLQSAIERNCAIVVTQLLPIVRATVPHRWFARLGKSPNDAALEQQLTSEIQIAFGKPSVYLDRIKIRLIFKDITASMLQDPDFVKMAFNKGLDLAALYEEYQAARVRV